MTETAEGRRRALELLRETATPHGFIASPEATANYRRVWARDGVVCGLAGLVAGDNRLVEALRSTLEILARHQGPDGQIPSNLLVDERGETRKVSFGGSAGRIDTIPWFVVGVAHLAQHSADDDFATAMAPAVERGLRLLTAWEFNRRGLVYVPQSGSWADEYPHHGYLLHVQLLRLWALRCDARLFGRADSAERAAHLRRLLRVNFWPRRQDRESDLVYHPPVWTAWAEERGEPPYGLCALQPAGYLDQFDALANSLAVLLQVPSRRQIDRLLDHGQSLRDVGPSRLVPCHWPPLTPESPAWPGLAANARYGFKNEPGRYHNGGVWPVINGWWGCALHKAGRTDAARQILARIEELNRRTARPGEAWGFYEFADAQTGEPGGTPRLAWSAAGSLLLHAALDGRSLWFGEESAP